MTIKIVLSELEKCLFPEFYPYYNQYFYDDINYLQKRDEYDKTSMLNLVFKIKVVKYGVKVMDKNLRYVLNCILNKHIDNYLDWHREYDWHELKSILMFFLVFSEVSNTRELVNLFEDKPIKVLFAKYLPKKY